MFIYPFRCQLPSPAADLPATLISLEDWSLIQVEGSDSRSYLQGQLTCDINSLTTDHYTQAGHCDAKGKVWSNLLLLPYQNGFAYLERTSVVSQQLSELKKYAVFSKVTMETAKETTLLGLAGHNARQQLSQVYNQLPDANQLVVNHPNATLIYLAQPSERFIIIATNDEAKRLYDCLTDNSLASNVAVNNSQQWLALDIEAGQPIIDLPNSQQFLPQAINLQALDAISFTKGCYSGQEMVARAKYRGANKRALYWLSGLGQQLPAVGDELEMKLGDNWRRTGTVLAAVQLANQQLSVQVVMSNDIEADSQFRLRDEQDSQLTIQALPYSINE